MVQHTERVVKQPKALSSGRKQTALFFVKREKHRPVKLRISPMKIWVQVMNPGRVELLFPIQSQSASRYIILLKTEGDVQLQTRMWCFTVSFGASGVTNRPGYWRSRERRWALAGHTAGALTAVQ
ncbi:hypothetical protein EVAR_89771_1 [Eumeta japonica]|uniref:Uncharacterized protein n=1 Tax=Eumeta variegata TaxID=151549 RepID=A0A4C1XFX3_EUMVA|nr:hypothetical protein EVAR_89771_1 [Eumeta japonica]